MANTFGVLSVKMVTHSFKFGSMFTGLETKKTSQTVLAVKHCV